MGVAVASELTMALAVPSGRTPEGEILVNRHSGDMAPSGRQLDLGLNYRISADETSSFEFGAVYSMDVGHVADNSGAAFAARFSQRF